MLLIIIYALVFVAALLAVDRFFRVFAASRRKDKEVNFRLEMLKSSGNKLDTYDELLRMRGLAKGGARKFSGRWFSEIYTQSGLQANSTQQTLFVIAAAVGSFLAWRMFSSNYYFIAAMTAASTIAIPILFVLWVRARRMKKFQKQLSPSIEVMIRSLGAGHPLPSAINLVANEMPDPIGSEFGILSDELTYGIELDDALLNLVERVGLDETKLLAVSISVQRGTGGNLIEILQNLATMVRDRIMMKAKIKAISAEGRITAVIMAMFPFFLFFMIRAMVPTYFDPLWNSGYGGIVVTVCGVFMVFGIFILYRLVKFDF
jgi:tight adherence protein B